MVGGNDMNINFSAHAFKRVDERLSLSPFYVSSLINTKTINIGSEPKSNREHLLFYSESDRDCFVIIYDVKCKHVITILPVEYHNLCAWVVTDDAQRQAREMFIKNTTIEQSKGKKQPPRAHRLSVILRDNMPNIHLGTINHKLYGYDVTDIVQNEQFLEGVKQRLLSKSKSRPEILTDIYAVSIQTKKTSTPDIFRINGLNREKFTMRKMC